MSSKYVKIGLIAFGAVALIVLIVVLCIGGGEGGKDSAISIESQASQDAGSNDIGASYDSSEDLPISNETVKPSDSDEGLGEDSEEQSVESESGNDTSSITDASEPDDSSVLVDDSGIESDVDDSSTPEENDSSVADDSCIVDNSEVVPDDSSITDDSSVADDSSETPSEDDSSKVDDTSTPVKDESSKTDDSSMPVEDESSKTDDSSMPVEDESSTVADVSQPDDAGSTDAMFTDRDYRASYDASSAIYIRLNGNTATCNSNKVNVSGTTVTIKDEGTYVVSGTYNNGMLVVNAEITDKIQIVLNGVSITKTSSAALYVKSAGKVFVTLPADTVNTLISNGAFVAFDDSNIDGAVFSKEDITFNGSGKLTVSSSSGHGIVSKDDVAFTGGTFVITSGLQGVAGKNSVRVGGGVFTINAGKDGFHAENIDDTTSGFFYSCGGSASITAGSDGISGAAYVTLNGGTFIVKAAGGYTATIGTDVSAKGVKSAGIITVNAGTTLNLNSADDGIHSDSNIKINGGTVVVKSGLDGFQADGTLTIEGGTFNVTSGGGAGATIGATESANAIEATGLLTINGGTFTVSSAEDGVHSNSDVVINGGTFNINVADDGFHANNVLTVNKGKIIITKSYEGLEGLGVVVNGGDISLVASDDGINAAGGQDSSGITGGRPGRPGENFSAGNGYIKINGGKLTVNASGDGIDANGSVEINGGEVYLAGPTGGGNGVFDYDASAKISGGSFIGAGTADMAQNFTSAVNQGSAMFRVNNQAANTQIVLKDANGNVLLSWTAPKNYALVIVSCASLKQGQTYTLTAGTYSTTFTLSTLVYGSGGGGGGMRP